MFGMVLSKLLLLAGSSAVHAFVRSPDITVSPRNFQGRLGRSRQFQRAKHRCVIRGPYPIGMLAIDKAGGNDW
jgi:hypothetical protein